MYYVLGKEREDGKKNGAYHVYEIAMERKRAEEAVESLMEFDKSTAPAGKPSNMGYKVIETDGKEFFEEYFKTFSICYEKEAILQMESISDYIKWKLKEEEEHDRISIEIIDTIGGAHYIEGRVHDLPQSYGTLIATIIDTLKDAIDLGKKRDGKG